MKNRQIWLCSRPNGIPQAADFTIRDADMPVLSDGEFLVRNEFLSADPAMRGWIADKSTYWPRIEVGDTMRAFSVGDVVESRDPAYAVGDKVMGIFGWQDYAAVKQPQVMRKVLESDLPLSLSLGVLGLNGLTAYFGLLDICRPKAGETVVISTAAGGVGSAAGQIAKIRGCRAIGFAGGPEKVRQCVEDFGYDAAIDWDWKEGSPDPLVPVDHFSARWSGWLKAPKPGRYRLGLHSDNGARLWLDGKLHVDAWQDKENYEQLVVSSDVLDPDQARWLQDGMEVQVSSHEGTPVGVTLPKSVVLPVIEADAVVRGQTASSSYKPAVVEGGIKVMVPPHIAVGTKLVINTEDGSYMERAKD